MKYAFFNNLLEETIEDLKYNGKTPEDVRWVGNEDFWFTWKDFEKVGNVMYKPDTYYIYVPLDLMIVGDDWWLERREGNDDETGRWIYRKFIRKPDKYFVPKNIINKECPSLTLSELNGIWNDVEGGEE